jgi:glutathione S-transferase
MKLYYTPGTCALAPHIVALEAGIPLELVKVDLKSKTVRNVGDFWAINPKGYVPALELDDGERLTEGPAIMQYLADLKPASRLAPGNGTFARVRLQEMLNYITAEIHKTYSPLFSPDVLPQVRDDRLAYLRKRYAYLENLLEGRNYLLGEQISIADFYHFTVTRWARGVKLDLSEFPRLEGLQKRIGSRKSALQAMREEGLIPEDKAA